MAPRKSPDIFPLEIITDILLKLPPKPLSKFKCVSKSWLRLISSPKFVKAHLNLSNHNKVLYLGYNDNFKMCDLPSLFHQEPRTNEVFDMDSPTPNHPLTVGSANGLIYLFSTNGEAFLWNPTIKKSKKLSKFGFNTMEKNPRSCGFGYDELHDEYKVVTIEHVSLVNTVVNVHCLRTDSWKTTTHDEFQGGVLLSCSGQFVNGKLYWASAGTLDDIINAVFSSGRGLADDLIVSKVGSFDITNETWGMLDLPDCVKQHLMLGVVGSDLSLLSTCCLGCSDVWIMKEDRGGVAWRKMFTIKYTLDVCKRMLIDPLLSYSIHFSESSEGEILLLLPNIIMIYNPKDGSIRQREVLEFEKSCTANIYVESLVDPLDL